MSVLRVTDPITLNVTYHADLATDSYLGNGKRGNAYEAGVQFYQSIVSNKRVAGAAVSITPYEYLTTNVLNSRAYYQGGRDTVVQGQVSRSTTVHELGHFLEDHDPDALAASAAFIERRTQGETLRKMSEITGISSYDDWELAKPDKFLTPYIGKTYTDSKGKVSATEVTSMGIQYMYEDPVAFALRDPEHFNHTLAVIRGYYNQ